MRPMNIFLGLALLVTSASIRRLLFIGAAIDKDEIFEDWATTFQRSRQLSPKATDQLAESAEFYRFVIESSTGRALNVALWRLSSLLHENPRLQRESNEPWDLLVRAADAGNEQAQHRLASAYSTGIYGEYLVPMDAGKGLWLEYMAALSGDQLAAMSMGYRFLYGVGVAQSCEKALPFYEYAANFAATYIEDLGYAPYADLARLTEQSSDYLRTDATQELTDYYESLALDGDAQALSLLGSLYLTGSRSIACNESRAVQYLRRAQQLGFTQVAGTLGLLLLRRRQRFLLHGRPEDRDSLGADFELAIGMLRTGLKKSQPAAMVGMGFANLHGLGVPRNTTLAMEFFSKALPVHPDAGLFLGDLLMGLDGSPADPSEPATVTSMLTGQESLAAQAYNAAAQLGNVLAAHRWGHMLARGVGVPRSCDPAAASFKLVAERGPWVQKLAAAHVALASGRVTEAIDLFALHASIGYESAQFNAAHLLSTQHCLSPMPPRQDSHADSAAFLHPMQFVSLNISAGPSPGRRSTTSVGTSSDCDLRAMALYALSAQQHNAEAFVLLGDFYYYGRAKLPVARLLAAGYYQQAAQLKHTQAVFNLGLMHEAGDGVKQDFHLAKRYFDQAADLDVKARLPRDIALILLQAHKSLVGWLQSDVFSAETANWLQESVTMALHWLQRVDESVHEFLDSATVWYYALQRRLLRRQATRLLTQMQQVQMKFLEHLNAFADGKPIHWHLSPAEEFELLISLCALLIVLLLIRFYT